MDYESDFLLDADPLELSDVLEFLEGKNVVQQKQMIKYNRCRLITKKYWKCHRLLVAMSKWTRSIVFMMILSYCSHMIKKCGKLIITEAINIPIIDQNDNADYVIQFRGIQIVQKYRQLKYFTHSGKFYWRGIVKIPDDAIVLYSYGEFAANKMEVICFEKI